jgi:hypothetical protein
VVSETGTASAPFDNVSNVCDAGAYRSAVRYSTAAATFRPSLSRRAILEPGYWSSEALIGRAYDVSPDGKRFLVVIPPREKADPPDVVVVQHWDEELKRLVPVK